MSRIRTYVPIYLSFILLVPSFISCSFSQYHSLFDAFLNDYQKTAIFKKLCLMLTLIDRTSPIFSGTLYLLDCEVVNCKDMLVKSYETVKQNDCREHKNRFST